MLRFLRAAVLQGDGDGGAEAEAQQDSAARLAGLYRRYALPIYRYAYSRTSNRQDAEDVTEQVFMDALGALKRYEERGQEAAWLFTIARRRLADFHRARRDPLPFDEALDAPDARPEGEVDRRERLAHLERLLATLDEEQLELLRLRFAADLTYGEIGRLLGKREAAVKVAVQRLLTRLRGAWHHPAVEADNE